MAEINRCQAEVERIIRPPGFVSSGARFGSRQVFDREIGRCTFRAKGHREGYPPYRSAEDHRFQFVTIAVCGVHMKGDRPRKAETA